LSSIRQLSRTESVEYLRFVARLDGTGVPWHNSHNVILDVCEGFNIMMTRYYGWGCALLTVATAIGSAPVAFAADGLMGECRAAKQSTGLYKERSSTSVLLTSLKMGDKVTIAEAAPKEGMAAVSTPSKGFVQTMNLKMCEGAKPAPKPDPKPNASSCRLVTQVKGLAIRKEPMTTAEAVSGVGPNEKITLVMPAESKNTDDGRTWIKISKPAEGWVSEGFTNGSKNVTACP
jgi:hypothetical protein